MIFLLATALPAQNYHAYAVPGEVKSSVKIDDDDLTTDDLDGDDVFGTAVANLGDLNNDGVTDLVVGAPTDENGDLGEGAAYILFMKSDGTIDSFNKISDGLDDGSPPSLGVTGNENFAISVAGIGDLNGDGVEDFVAGAHRDENTNNNEGAIFVMFMKTDGTADSFVKVSNGLNDGPALDADDRFGHSVADMGDLNGDGIGDIAVGAFQDESTGGNADADEGAVHILFMDNDGSVKTNPAIVKIDDDDLGAGDVLDGGDQFGFALANIGDLNGDGINDLAVGAPDDDDDESNSGAVYILFLDTNGADVKSDPAPVKITDGVNGGPTIGQSDQFGQSIGVIPDLDGDGVQELIVGAGDDESDVSGDSGEGAIFVLFMNTDGTAKSSLKISDNQNGGPTGLDAGDQFGRSVAALGDLDGDGFSELAVGARVDESAGGPNAEGAVHILFMEGFVSSSSGSSGDFTPPTLGVGTFGKRLIDNGFSYNGNPIDVDSFHTEYSLVRTQVGQTNILDLKIFENQGVNDIEFVSVHFGVPQIHAQGEAIVTYYPSYDYTKIHDPENLLDIVDISLEPVKCKANSEKVSCAGFSFEHSFNEAPIHDIVRVTLADKTKNHSDVFFNDGVQVFGESLNTPETIQIAAQGKDRGLVKLTQTDRENDLWIDQYDNTWTRNMMGGWLKESPNEFLKLDDNSIGSNGYKRMHMHYSTYKMGQELIAKQIWDSSIIQSEYNIPITKKN